MKLTIFLAGIFLGTYSFANTIIYTCKTISDDGDAYGETLVIGIDDSKEIERHNLSLLSDYMGASSGVSDSSKTNTVTVTFVKFDTSAYDSNGDFVKNLKIIAPKTLIEEGPAEVTIKLADDKREG